MNEPNGNAPVTVAAEIVPLDDALVALLGEYAQQAAALDGQRRGALMLFMRQHGLQGNWRLSDNGRELVRAE